MRGWQPRIVSSAPQEEHGDIRVLEPARPHGLLPAQQLREDAGLALRFPRFTGRRRDDKSHTDATTVTEAVEMYRAARRPPAGS